MYRIDPVSGVATAFATGPPFVTPVAVVRDAGGEIFVGDAGTCSPCCTACTGGSILHVDPVAGITTLLASGGFIEGAMDLAIAVPEPGVIPMLAFGLGLLVLLSRRRTR